MSIDWSSYIILFSVVETILARCPLQFLKADIGVEIYKPLDSRKVHVDSRKDLNQEHCLSKDISSCVVEVRGVKTSTQQMALQYYFEGKHGADEDIKHIDFDEEKNIYLLTFESESGKIFLNLNVKKYTLNL